MHRVFSSAASAAPSAAKGRLERLRETSVGKSLNVRALLVDSALFRRTNRGDESTKKEEFRVSSRFDPNVVTKDMLTKQVRAELRKRGLDGIGKPWVVKKRLEEARDAEKEVAELDAKLAGEEKPSPPTPPVEDIRAKYAEKMRGRSLASQQVVSRQQGDAESLQFAKEAVHKSELQKSPSQWRIGPPGMRTLLEFVAARSMFLVLVTRTSTTDQELKELRDQAGVHFDVVRRPRNDDDDDNRRQGNFNSSSSSSWANVCRTLEIEPHQSLSFVDDDLAAREARNSGSLTCLLLGDDDDDDNTTTTSAAGDNNHRRTRRSKSPGGAIDYVVSKCAEVSDVINDLNGTSYRAAVLHHTA